MYTTFSIIGNNPKIALSNLLHLAISQFIVINKMVVVGLKQVQILRSIICYGLVYMMDCFSSFKSSTNDPFGYIPVLKNISTNRIRISWKINFAIATAHYHIANCRIASALKAAMSIISLSKVTRSFSKWFSAPFTGAKFLPRPCFANLLLCFSRTWSRLLPLLKKISTGAIAKLFTSTLYKTSLRIKQFLAVKAFNILSCFRRAVAHVYNLAGTYKLCKFNLYA